MEGVWRGRTVTGAPARERGQAAHPASGSAHCVNTARLRPLSGAPPIRRTSRGRRITCSCCSLPPSSRRRIARAVRINSCCAHGRSRSPGHGAHRRGRPRGRSPRPALIVVLRSARFWGGLNAIDVGSARHLAGLRGREISDGCTALLLLDRDQLRLAAGLETLLTGHCFHLRSSVRARRGAMNARHRRGPVSRVGRARVHRALIRTRRARAARPARWHGGRTRVARGSLARRHAPAWSGLQGRRRWRSADRPRREA